MNIISKIEIESIFNNNTDKKSIIKKCIENNLEFKYFDSGKHSTDTNEYRTIQNYIYNKKGDS